MNCDHMNTHKTCDFPRWILEYYCGLGHPQLYKLAKHTAKNTDGYGIKTINKQNTVGKMEHFKITANEPDKNWNAIEI